MANIKSQIKRNRTNEAARLRNKSVKSSLKTAVRRVRAAIAYRMKSPGPGPGAVDRTRAGLVPRENVPAARHRR